MRHAPARMQWVALYLGIGGSIALGAALLLAVAPSPAILASRLPMVGAISAHALVGRAAFLGIAAHGILYFFYWLSEVRHDNARLMAGLPLGHPSASLLTRLCSRCASHAALTRHT